MVSLLQAPEQQLDRLQTLSHSSLGVFSQKIKSQFTSHHERAAMAAVTPNQPKAQQNQCNRNIMKPIRPG